MRACVVVRAGADDQGTYEASKIIYIAEVLESDFRIHKKRNAQEKCFVIGNSLREKIPPKVGRARRITVTTVRRISHLLECSKVN